MGQQLTSMRKMHLATFKNPQQTQHNATVSAYTVCEPYTTFVLLYMLSQQMLMVEHPECRDVYIQCRTLTLVGIVFTLAVLLT